MGITEFHLWRLVGDVLVACALSFALALLVFFSVRYCRRSRQFSLRTVLCVVALAGIICAVYAHVARARHTEREAVAEMERIGWVVFQRDGEALPEWLFRLLTDLRAPGLSAFTRVSGIRWGDSAAAPDTPHTDVNAMLRGISPQLSRIRHCVWVEVKDSRLSDAGVAELCEHLSECSCIELDGSPSITDAALKYVVDAWPDIESISISGSSISDAGLSFLAENALLREAAFCKSVCISDVGIAQLARILTLERLTISMGVLSDEQLDTLVIEHDLSISLCD